MNLHYSLTYKKDLTEKQKKIFGVLLREQGKVQGDVFKKSERCKFILIVYDDDTPIAIGAIKPKTSSDFQIDKANLESISKSFDWELGYIYTKRSPVGNGIASNIVTELLNEYGNGNLMASTEIIENPKMVKILINQGFQQLGNTWKSTIHNNLLGLFIRWNR